jgi:hypothetical protein
MTPEELALLRDSRLSPAARVCGLYIAGHQDEWVEVSRDDYRRLLCGAGRERVYKALGELELWGYVDRRVGGKGHSDSFRFSGRKTVPLKDTGREIVPLNPDSGSKSLSLNGASSSPASSPSPAGVRTRETDVADDPALAQLRAALAPHDPPIDRLRRTTGSTEWAASIWDWYRPATEADAGGTKVRDLEDLTPAEAMEVVAMAIADYASKGHRWDGRLFRGFVRAAAKEARKAKLSREHEAAEVTAAAKTATPHSSFSRAEPLPPDVLEWAERLGALLEAAVQTDADVAAWEQETAELIQRHHQDDRSFLAKREGDRREHIRLRVLNAYGQKIGDPRPSSAGRRSSVLTAVAVKSA